MKITSKILSIPPYISTAWNNVSSLNVREENGSFTLKVLLTTQACIEVPGLDRQTIDAIFKAHADAIDQDKVSGALEPISFSVPLASNGALLTPEMAHNPEQGDMPPIPAHILKKIAMIAKAFGLDAMAVKPEPHCNCPYCQIARSFQQIGEEDGEEISEQDLQFRNWTIQQLDEKLYAVVNPLEPGEKYQVFLGTPLGCTCGMQNCEHIRAVLNEPCC